MMFGYDGSRLIRSPCDGLNATDKFYKIATRKLSLHMVFVGRMTCNIRD